MKRKGGIAAREAAGAAFTVAMAFVLHFLYEWTGKNRIIGVFAAVNESVWEHTKMIFVPYLVYAVIVCPAVCGRGRVGFRRYFVAKTAGLLFIDYAVISFFYTYSGILGTHFLWLDISSAVLWALLAHFISYRIMTGSGRAERYFPLMLVVLVLLLAALFCFTPNPPKIPLFRDSLTGRYGMG